MRFRFILLGAGALLSSASFASYEILLMTDYYNGKINRYDPQSGAFLGSFGQGFLANPTKLALDESKGLVYVSNYGTGTVQVFNYSTGVYENEFPVSSFTWGLTRLSNGNLATANGGSVVIYTPTGGFVSSFSAAGYGCDTDGTYIYVGGSNQVTKYTLAGALVGTLNIATGAHSVYDVKVRNGVAYVGGSGYLGTVGTFNTNTMSGYTEKFVGALSNTANSEALAMGHGYAMYVSGQSTASGNPVVVARYNTYTGVSGATFASQANGVRVTGMAIVVAPEPGTWAAMGLGALILLRRRKR